ncbi:MAG: beta-eliminating lyase-related protein [Eubacteriales bacterium]|nr:beta-eliminating lyase-related protein [Eubacteriales bacterium]
MLNFGNDYSRLAHPDVMGWLVKHANESNTPYGLDSHSERAKTLIYEACQTNPEEHWIYFFQGGTQVNLTAIKSLIQAYESVVAVDTAHIVSLEAGAIEATGHKIDCIPGVNGKMDPERLKYFLKMRYEDEHRLHSTKPGLLYITQPTELGTVYTAKELEALSEICRESDLRLYVDGARLAVALADPEAPSLAELARFADGLTIGATKMGAVSAEALLLKLSLFSKHFFTVQKQCGALASKGFFQGLQFEALFEDGLYLEIGRKIHCQSMNLAAALVKMGYRFYMPPASNQLFLLLSEADLKALRSKMICERFGVSDEEVVVRLVLSYASSDAEVDAAIEVFRQLKQGTINVD